MKKYIILFIFLIEACSITPNSRFYQLQAATGDESLSNRKMIIGINDISIPTYVDRPQIVITETDSNELKVSEFNRWAEPLNMSIARVLADDMSLYLPNSLIKPKSYASEDFNYAVTVEINKFDEEAEKCSPDGEREEKDGRIESHLLAHDLRSDNHVDDYLHHAEYQYGKSEDNPEVFTRIKRHLVLLIM